MGEKFSKANYLGISVKEKILKLLVITFEIITLISCNKKEPIKFSKIFIDELGKTVKLNHTPQRIISSAPNITEILFALGVGDKVVGITKFCDYPPETKTKEVIGDLINLNFEKIEKLKPDIVFMTPEGNTKDTYEKLIALNIPVYVINPRNIKEIHRSILNLGKVLEVEVRADSLVKSLEFQLEKLQQTHTLEKHGMFIVSLSPLILAGGKSFINDILRIAKLKNIAENSQLAYPIFSREEILKQNPEIIIVPFNNNYSKESILKVYPEWRDINAIQKNQIIYVNPDLFFRPGPRYIEAIEYLISSLNNFST